MTKKKNHLERIIRKVKEAFIYIMSNKNRTTTYIGVTNDIERRVMEHKSSTIKGFTSRYKLYYLVYFERILGMSQAIEREKQLKNWHKEWKWNLIRSENKDLKDLSEGWYD